MNTIKTPVKTARILNFFLACMLLILARIWFLSMIQHDHYLELSEKPRTRTVIERPERGTIRDRFNILLAHNAPQYNVAVCYSDIRQIPSIRWVRDENGKKVRFMARRKYIEEFSAFLANELDLDPLDVEDLIHGKACLFPHTPFVLKEDVSESLYYRLKGTEKDWPSLILQQSEKRVYPQGKLACDVVGYMGAISQREYLQIGQEMKALNAYLKDYDKGQPVFLPKGFSSPEEVKKRLLDLEEMSYTINDHLGKSGIEASFDEKLRGSIGKSFYEVDIKGNTLKKLPGGKEATPGDRLVLTLSAELQQEAEKLLAEYEQLQDLRDKASPSKRQTPWQRGGAIVAIEPNTGEVLAFASHPRFDPNDLLPMQTVEKRKEKQGSILKWLESPTYIGEIWDGLRPLEREIYLDGEYVTESFYLTWDKYVDLILDEQCAVKKVLTNIKTIADAIYFDENLLDQIPFERDQCLLLDLLALAVPKECFTESLLDHVGEQSLEQLRAFSQLVSCQIPALKEQERKNFHKGPFRTWRTEHFREFLKEKRRAEKAKHTWARPYTDYLERQEREMFATHWQENRASIVLSALSGNSDLAPIEELLAPLSKEDKLAYILALRSFADLDQPLQGKYPMLRKENGHHVGKHLAAAFYPYGGFGYGRSQAFRQASPMGSIFKVIPAYAGLKQQYDLGKTDLNPLRLTDDMQWTSSPGSNSQVLGYFPDGTPIKRFYKGGRLPRGYPKIGELDVTSALERTSNIYFSILAGDILDSPTTLLQTAMGFGLGTKTNIDLPGEYHGTLPNDILHNKTGLYSFAIGQHSLVVTPLQSAMMFAAIANGGKVLKPQIVKFAINRDGVTHTTSQVEKTVDMPDAIRNSLLSGMHKVLNGEKGTARPALIRKAFHEREAVAAYTKLKSQMVGKTGTAEIFYKQTIDAETKAQMEKHVWFGSIGFKEDTLETPELVVVVYSRFGSAGKQGAPIAARLLEKWREISSSHYNEGNE
ncbi:MAG: penicillin-binding transpeptidase domain-containing protein [Simkaniaceae bacterium]|nr:penicillin-binding transpeptidase domain-containing protein [Candidatus Sacchlamyda saccharinae]